MFSLYFVAVVASVQSLFAFVAATPDPLPTPPPDPTAFDKRQVAGAPGTPILSTIQIPYTALPEQVYPYAVLRGPQSGYNICNSTTQGPGSRCQTLIVNSISDFCLWGSPIPDGSIGDEEASVVAYCSLNTHGARPIAPGAIYGAQFVSTSAYVQIRGFVDNGAIGLDESDSGGELDPHGADLQGNPLGGVVYSNNSLLSSDGQYSQVYNWNMFVGGGQFCLKICFNSITSPDYCLNTYDLIGCDYNMPSNVQNGTFTSCESDLQDVVGVYSVNGVTSTWSMPQTLVGPPPYTPRVPASSSCTTYQSSDLFVATSTTSKSTSATATGSRSTSSGRSGSGTGSGATSTSTSVSSSVRSIGLPSAFYVLGFGIMAGAVLVF